MPGDGFVRVVRVRTMSRYAGTVESIYEPLTDRELTVLRLIADGHSNEEIADQLGLSLHTVKTFVKHIFGKLQASRRTQAVAVGQSLGLLAAPSLTPGHIPTPPTP